MIAVYALQHIDSSTKESVFPATEVSHLKIPKSYLDAILDSLNAQDRQEVIHKELRSLKANGT
jgi:hypothetical protein